MSKNRRVRNRGFVKAFLNVFVILVVCAGAGVLFWATWPATSQVEAVDEGKATQEAIDPAVPVVDVSDDSAMSVEETASGSEQVEWCLQTPENDCGKAACASEKRVIILFEAKWCGWCRRLKTNILPDTEVRKLLKNFFLVDVDSEKNAKLVKDSGVTAYPSWFIIEKSCEKVIDAFTGSPRTPKDFVKRFKTYLTH